MKITTILPISAVLSVLCVACTKPAPPPPPAPTVLVAQPLVRQITDWDDYAGRFEAVEAVDIRPRVSGAIQSVHFEDGQRVQKGQLLFVIDARSYAALLARAKAELAGARAALANADAELKRSQSLIASQLISQAQADLRVAAQLQAAANLAAAEAAVATHSLNVSFTRITAPISGRASYRRLTAGNIVTADNTLLTTLVTEDPIRFVFDAPESALLRYRRDGAGGRNSPVEIRLQDETEYRWKGKIDFMDNAMDRSSGTIRGRAVLDNPKGFISPGMFGQMRLFGAKPFEALMLPDEAVSTDQTRQVVYTVGPDDVIVQKEVKPGRLMEGLRVIREGLSRDDRVVISGVQRARPGRKVVVTQGTVSAFPSGVSRGENGAMDKPGAATAVPSTPSGAVKP
jgi:RND family efflux transporter MFP subunit